MGLNKSKKIAKKSVKPDEPVLEEEIKEVEEVEEVETEQEAVVEEPAPAKRARKSKKDAAPEAEDDEADVDISFDTDTIVNGICDDKRNLTTAVYQVQLRLPADIEPMYKSISPRLKRALRDAFAELVRKAYAQTH